jgi:FkbM family methyltransferase
MTSSQLSHAIWHFIQSHRRNPAIRALAHMGRYLHRAYEHPGYDIAINGEAALLRFVSREPGFHRLFDVGANQGDWTAIASDCFPNGEVHAFEIAEPTFHRLQARLGRQANVILNNCGLADREETVVLTFCPEHPELTTADVLPHDVPTQQLSARVTTGDAYLAARGLEQVDFLKIDVEGLELRVLQGFAKTLRNHPPKVIQFEHHLGRAYLVDYYHLLKPLGYRLGKLYSTYVDFREHHGSMEDGIGPNYVAVHTSQERLIERLHESLS